MIEYFSFPPIYSQPTIKKTEIVPSMDKRQFKHAIKRKLSPDGNTLTIIVYDETTSFDTSKKYKILHNFTLTKKSADEVLSLRYSLKPILIVKYLNSFYVCEVTKAFNVSSLMISHKCSICKNCYATPTECGGCDKVRDHFNQTEFRKDEYLSKIDECKRIEKYPFIGFGMETYNVESPNIIVFVCKDFISTSST